MHTYQPPQPAEASAKAPVPHRDAEDAVTGTPASSSFSLPAVETAVPRAAAIIFSARPSRASQSKKEATHDDATPRQCAAVFQGKLQRALWLDQLLSCAQNEACRRAVLRCAEAEARDHLWWPYQRLTSAIRIREDYGQQSKALQEAQYTRQQQVLTRYVSNMMGEEEPSARETITQGEAAAFHLICSAAQGEQLRFSAQHLAQEQEEADRLRIVAWDVRALEMKVAEQGHCPFTAFNPSLDALARCAEGIHATPLSDMTPLERWRAKYKPQPAPDQASLRNPHKTHTTPPASPRIAASELIITEMYARRSLRFDEKKERLLLEHWGGTVELRFNSEALARRQLTRMFLLVTSPLGMRAVLTLQRWWRMLRGGHTRRWSQYRRHMLVSSLAAMPDRYATSKYKRRLQVLERDHVEGVPADSKNSIASQLAALTTAATHPRRYAAQLDLYTYTVVQHARAMFSGVSLPPRVMAAASLVSGVPLLRYFADGGSLPLRVYYRHRPPYDAWRRRRWLPHSPLPGHASAVETAEQATRSALHCEEARSDTCLMHDVHIARPGTLAVRDTETAVTRVAKEETQTRTRIVRQEAFERTTWPPTVAALSAFPSHPTPVASSSSHSLANALPQHFPPVQLPWPQEAVKASYASSAKSDTAVTAAEPLGRAALVEASAHRAFVALSALQHEFAYTPSTAEGCAATQAAPSQSIKDAVCRYRVAFDKAASAVSQEQYASVLQRYAAGNAALLRDIAAYFQSVALERSAVVAEEQQSRQLLIARSPSACCIQLCELTTLEAVPRKLLETQQAREADLLQELIQAQMTLARWAVPAGGKWVRVSQDAVAVAMVSDRREGQSLDPLTPVDRFVSREDVCRTRLFAKYKRELCRLLLECHRAFGEAQLAAWKQQCRQCSEVFDTFFTAHPPP